MRIKLQQYWILDSVVRGEYPLSLLGDEKKAQAFNKAWHGMGECELFHCLDALIHDGDINLLLPVCENSDFQIVTLSSKELREALQYKPILNSTINEDVTRYAMVHYGMTPQGGRKWEYFSKPNWDLFVYRESDEQHAQIIACNEEAVKKTLELERYCGNIPVNSTEIWDSLVPWQATYWKSLQHGYRVSYKYATSDSLPKSPAIRAWENQINNWYLTYSTEN